MNMPIEEIMARIKGAIEALNSELDLEPGEMQWAEYKYALAIASEDLVFRHSLLLSHGDQPSVPILAILR